MISAEKAGPGRLWHSWCFTCVTCTVSLANFLYYYSEGHLYCGRLAREVLSNVNNTLMFRDFSAKMGIPRCGACDELIFSDEFVKAEDQTWHTEHFACWTCDTRLAGSRYVMLGLGQPACVTCWSASSRRTCAACGQDIR